MLEHTLLSVQTVHVLLHVSVQQYSSKGSTRDTVQVQHKLQSWPRPMWKVGRRCRCVSRQCDAVHLVSCDECLLYNHPQFSMLKSNAVA